MYVIVLLPYQCANKEKKRQSNGEEEPSEITSLQGPGAVSEGRDSGLA